jgi:hypothetical protein
LQNVASVSILAASIFDSPERQRVLGTEPEEVVKQLEEWNIRLPRVATIMERQHYWRPRSAAEMHTAPRLLTGNAAELELADLRERYKGQMVPHGRSSLVSKSLKRKRAAEMVNMDLSLMTNQERPGKCQMK